MNDTASTKLAARGLVDSVHQALLEQILSGELPPNQTLLERPVAMGLGVSRTVLREALRQLEGQRFVGRRSDGSLFVRPITVEELLDVLHVRALLESDAASRAVGRLDIDVLTKLRERVIAVRDAEHPDIAEHDQIDSILHDLIASRGGGEVVRSIIFDMRRRNRMFSMKRIPSRFHAVCEEHLSILDALIAEKPEEAASAVRTHLNNIRESVIQWLKHT
jgi:DNA-binding GntR family transcriptional regulator